MKRGQFYMFAAIILVTAVFLIVANSSKVSLSNIEGLEKYRENYLYEANIVIDNAIFHDENISVKLSNYTENFIKYGDKKSLGLGIMFAYPREGRITIVNYLKGTVLIETYGITLAREETTKVPFTSVLSFGYLNESHEIRFSDPDHTQLKAIFVKER